MKKLNMRGFSHDVLLVAFVAVFAIAGVGFLVASHAGTCGTYQIGGVPATGPVTVPSSTPGCGAVTLSCQIIGLPVNPTHGQVIQPNLVITNTGARNVHFNIYTSVSTYGPMTTNTSTPTSQLRATSHFSQGLMAGHTSTHGLKSYRIPYNTSTVASLRYRVSLASGGNQFCAGYALLPNPPTEVAKPLQ